MTNEDAKKFDFICMFLTLNYICCWFFSSVYKDMGQLTCDTTFAECAVLDKSYCG